MHEKESAVKATTLVAMMTTTTATTSSFIFADGGVLEITHGECKDMNLRGKSIKEEGCVVLAQVLASTPLLTSLNLSPSAVY
jgi:hypothetical protein